MAAGDIYAAKSSFIASVGRDNRVFVGVGDTVREGHPILKGREELFEPLKVKFEVEQPAPKQAPAKPAAKQAAPDADA